MRNEFAELALDSNMLILMKSYQSTLSNSHGKALDGAIQLLTQTNKLVTFIQSATPVLSLSDPRILQIQEVANFFQEWEGNKNDQNIMSRETREDVQFYIHGIKEIVRCSLNYHVHITPANINSDVVEISFVRKGVLTLHIVNIVNI